MKDGGFFQLIFIDLCMPEMDGYETFNKLRVFYSEMGVFTNIYVIACSGY